MNRNGQALIEFIMILPIVLLIIFGSIDLGNMFINKYQMINDLDMIIEVKSDQAKVDQILKDNKEVLNIKFDNGKYEYILSKDIPLFTPGINLIIGNPFEVKVSRILYE